MSFRMAWILRVIVCAAGCTFFGACSSGSPTAPVGPSQPPIKHVFTIILENQAYDNTFGSVMPVPYLSKTVAAQGALLENYYGTSHFSNGNYLTLISGQAVTLDAQDDCTNHTSSGVPLSVGGSNHVDIVVSGVEAYDQVKGDGCIYPAATKTIADQLSAKGLRWKGYMEDMGNDPTREAADCGEPGAGIGAPDNTDQEQVPPTYHKGGSLPIADRYAARHNPFVYFHSLLDSGACAKNVVPLNDKTLPADLASVATTPNYVFITPNLCNDGHDVPCQMPGSPSTLADENAFLEKWVPIIVRSPAFQADGLLMITFDESGAALGTGDGNTAIYDGSSCCNEPSGANTQLPGLGRLTAFAIAHGQLPPDAYAGTVGHSGGGRTGTILVSPFIKPGTVSTVEYNHYSTLRTIEDYFGLSHLGYAAYPGTTDFGPDVFGSTITAYSPKL
jgi:hypothetical protein